MDDAYGLLLFEDDLSSEQRAMLQERLEEEPELAEGWARWRRICAQLRRRLQERLPDRRLLVLYALDQEGRSDALTREEKEALDAARDDIARAIETVPALQRVVERIQEERADFERVWAQQQARSETDASEGRPRSERDERSPRQPARSREHTAGRRWTWRLTVAALLIGAVVLAIFYGPREASRTTVTAGADEQRVVEFDDGSTVRLVGTARLTYDPGMSTTEDRHVRLARGQAYFDVVHRDDASFVVNTPAAQAEVLGTQFGVTTGGDTTEVVLVEGSVRVGPDDEAEAEGVVLEPGERSIIQHGTSPSPSRPVDLTQALDWTGLFVFRSVSTQAIAQRLSEHYEVSIAVAPALAEEPVTGTFEREQPVSQVLETIARTLGAEVQTENGTYRLEPES